MRERKDSKNASPNPRPSNVGELADHITSTDVKELSFENSIIRFKQKGDIWTISLRQIAEEYEIPFKQAVQKLTRNRELFKDLGSGSVMLPEPAGGFDYYLSIRDAFAYLTLISYKRYSGERKERLIMFRNWLVDNAEKALIGEQIKRDYVPNLDELERMDGAYGDHSFLTGMVTHIVRRIRKKDPHSGCPSEQEIYQEDYNDILGPGKIVTCWRRGLNPLNGKKLTVKKFFQGSNLLAGNVRKEDCRVKVIKDIEEYCPQYKPDYMPNLKQIDPTKQTKLLGDGQP